MLNPGVLGGGGGGGANTGIIIIMQIQTWHHCFLRCVFFKPFRIYTRPFGWSKV